MRAPFQVLVIPFRRARGGIEYAILKRSDADYCQFIAGGGEDDETPLEAAQRETEEEVGISVRRLLMPLDSIATVPKDCFLAADSWGGDVLVIPEYCFAANVGDSHITLSHEHTEIQWVNYERARHKLRWESNRNALWELNERLKKEKSGFRSYTPRTRPSYGDN